MNKLKEQTLDKDAIIKGEEKYTLDDFARDLREITDEMTVRLEEMGKELGVNKKVDKEGMFRNVFIMIHFGALEKSPEEVARYYYEANPNEKRRDYASFVRAHQNQFTHEIEIAKSIFMRKYLDLFPDGETNKLTLELLNDYLQSYLKHNIYKK